MPNKGKKITRGKQIKPDSSWGKETMVFKVEKKKYRRNSEKVRCTGAKCMENPNKMERNQVYKGQECSTCYNEFFKDLRYSPQSETPNFDPQFLTRLDLA